MIRLLDALSGLIGRVWCAFDGHRPFVHDQLEDGTKIRGCTRCLSYVRRDVTDPRPPGNPDLHRWRMPVRLQHEIRHRAVRVLRNIRIRRERASFKTIKGGKAA